MGVDGLWGLIKGSGDQVKVELLDGKVLAIDISIWMHQVVMGYQDAEGCALPYAHLLGLFDRICKLYFYKIKPVFVFDGKAPDVKYLTLKKRYEKKSRVNREQERLTNKLLEQFSKEQIVHEALGEEAAKAIGVIPTISRRKYDPTENENDDEIFRLPENPDKQFKSEEDNGSSSEAESSQEEKSHRNKMESHFQNLQKIDINSQKFQKLPHEIRLEILNDMKEMRKQSSWNRLHELPPESQDYSSFQMSRLLKRRLVQTNIEQTEKEMGGKCLTMAELEAFLAEDGIESLQTSTVTKPIVSNEDTRMLIVKNLRKESEVKETKSECSPTKKLRLIESPVKEESDENDPELEAAIRLSLMDNDEDQMINEDCDNNDTETNAHTIKMNKDQRNVLAKAAQASAARAYMIEYVGMNAEDITDFMAETQNENNDQVNDDSGFIHNKTLMDGYTNEDDDVTSVVSSNADSDFVEVAPLDDLDEYSNKVLGNDGKLELNSPPFVDISKEITLEDLERKSKSMVEIVVNPNDDYKPEDDLFADVFAIKQEDSVEIVSQTIVDMSSETQADDVQVKQKDTKTNILDRLKQKLEQVKDITLDNLPLIESTTNISAVTKADEEKVISTVSLPECCNEDNDKSQGETDFNLTTSSLQIIEVSKPIEIIELSSEDENYIKTPKKLCQTSIKSFFKTVGKSDVTKEDSISSATVRVKSSQKKSLSSKKPDAKKTTVKVINKSKAATPSKNIFNVSPSTSFECQPSTSKGIVNSAAATLKESYNDFELETIAKETVANRQKVELELNKMNRQNTSITQKMQIECQQLLQLFGIPYIVAPTEAEAQCAFLESAGLTEGTITEDSDIWLFGGRTVYKNFFDNKKHVYEYRIEKISKQFHLNRNRFIQFALLVGSDYTEGIYDVGPVTAMDILAIFKLSNSDLSSASESKKEIIGALRQFRDWFTNKPSIDHRMELRRKLKNIRLSDEFPSELVVDSYLHPEVDKCEMPFKWGKPYVDGISDFVKKHMGWSREKLMKKLQPVLKRMADPTQQQKISNYFKHQRVSVSNVDPQIDSKRVQKAIQKLSNIAAVDDPDFEPDAPKKVMNPKRIVKKKASRPNTSRTSDSNISMEAGPSNRVYKKKTLSQKQRAQEKLESNKLKAIQVIQNSKKSSNK